MAMINVAVDTNILVYAEEASGGKKHAAAVELFEKMPRETTLIPVFVLGELFRVLVHKARQPVSKARALVFGWGDSFPLIELTSSVMLAAIDLSHQHQLRIWDAVILASAADAGCRLLLSEDFQEGFTWSGVTVTNPFSSKRHLLLDALLKEE
jgi:predicted nucleic acid-binding protein